MKNVILLLGIVLFASLPMNSQNLEGYTKHETIYRNGGKVTLYYKETNHAVYFRVYNESNETVHVKVNNVNSEWTDNRRRTKDVMITYVLAGKTSTGVYENNDNYAKLQGRWSFSGWKVSNNRNDLD
jgi:hypothetical protein